jgi:hypothetical protein
MDMINFTDFTDKYNCDICDIKCSRESEWNRHLLTRKHAIRANGNFLETKDFTDKIQHYICSICNKNYHSKGGLWKHEKKCINEMKNENNVILQDSSQNEIKVLTHLVLEIVKSNTELQKQSQDLQKQNQDLQKQIIDVCKNIQPSTINTNSHNTNTNSHNNTFNLQFFLNEQCKDAMNIKDFVKSIQIEMSDLERIGKEGYVEGISKLILEKLRETDIYKRPLHCSDAKRETMYIKEDDVWNKDESLTNEKLIRFIKDVDNKNYDFLMAYALECRDVFNGNSPLNTPFLFMVKNSTRDEESVKKVIKRILKEVLIKKEKNVLVI